MLVLPAEVSKTCLPFTSSHSKSEKLGIIRSRQNMKEKQAGEGVDNEGTGWKPQKGAVFSLTRSIFASSRSKSCYHLMEGSILMQHECLKRASYLQDLIPLTLQGLFLLTKRTRSSPKKKRTRLESIAYTHNASHQLRGLAAPFETSVVFFYGSCVSESIPAATPACAP